MGLRLVLDCTMVTEIGQTWEKLPFWTNHETSEDRSVRNLILAQLNTKEPILIHISLAFCEWDIGK